MFSASAVVLAPAFCFVCCRALASLSAASFAACLNCGFSRCNRPWLLQRPGTVEVFAAPLCHILQHIVRCVLLLLNPIFNSAAFCSSVAFLAIFCIGVTSHRRDSLDSVSALTWFSHSSFPSSSTPRPSWTCTCTRRGPLNLERVVECSSLSFRAFL